MRLLTKKVTGFSAFRITSTAASCVASRKLLPFTCREARSFEPKNVHWSKEFLAAYFENAVTGLQASNARSIAVLAHMFHKNAPDRLSTLCAAGQSTSCQQKTLRNWSSRIKPKMHSLHMFYLDYLLLKSFSSRIWQLYYSKRALNFWEHGNWIESNAVAHR